MDAVRYLKEKKRMCALTDCCDCPLSKGFSYACVAAEIESNDPEEAVDYVETWANTHRMVTNLDKFREVFGASDDEIKIVPSDWWIKEYKEPGKEI